MHVNPFFSHPGDSSEWRMVSSRTLSRPDNNSLENPSRKGTAVKSNGNGGKTKKKNYSCRVFFLFRPTFYRIALVGSRLEYLPPSNYVCQSGILQCMSDWIQGSVTVGLPGIIKNHLLIAWISPGNSGNSVNYVSLSCRSWQKWNGTRYLEKTWT